MCLLERYLIKCTHVSISKLSEFIKFSHEFISDYWRCYYGNTTISLCFIIGSASNPIGSNRRLLASSTNARRNIQLCHNENDVCSFFDSENLVFSMNDTFFSSKFPLVILFAQSLSFVKPARKVNTPHDINSIQFNKTIALLVTSFYATKINCDQPNPTQLNSTRMHWIALQTRLPSIFQLNSFASMSK